MKLITIKMDLIIDEDIDMMNDSTATGDYYDKEKISEYLTNRLYTDPEFFGDFGPENILSIQEID